LVKANVGHSSPPGLYDEFVWLGGKQKNYPSSREWSWADGRTMSYTHWNGGEPNNKDGNERCMQLFNTLENRDYTIYMVPRTWNDVDCNRKMRAFVCKR
ncbi:lectin C-type domain protein, partial [Cooperia oncophora]